MTVDKDNEEGYLYWANKIGDQHQLHFCGANCLAGYMSAKIVLIKQFRTKKIDYWGTEE